MEYVGETCNREEFEGECGSKIEECDTCSCNDGGDKNGGDNGGGDNHCDGGDGDGDVVMMAMC